MTLTEFFSRINYFTETAPQGLVLSLFKRYATELCHDANYGDESMTIDTDTLVSGASTLNAAKRVIYVSECIFTSDTTGEYSQVYIVDSDKKSPAGLYVDRADTYYMFVYKDSILFCKSGSDGSLYLQDHTVDPGVFTLYGVFIPSFVDDLTTSEVTVQAITTFSDDIGNACIDAVLSELVFVPEAPQLSMQYKMSYREQVKSIKRRANKVKKQTAIKQWGY